MGISRDSVHKRRATGGKQKPWRKKRKFELARPAAMTKLGARRVHTVRVRGGDVKFRALRLDAGNFSWGTEAVTRKTRIINVVYNASNNEFTRTNTLVKNTIVQVDATPFRQWYEAHYGVEVGKKKSKKDEKAEPEKKKSRHVQAVLKSRQAGRELDKVLEDQFVTGRLYACISSRPGQSGRADGYILEGQELSFYVKKLAKKYAVSPGEISLRWCIDQDIVPITTSSKEQRLSDYLRAMTFKLNPAEIKQINEAGSKKHLRGFWTHKYDENDKR